VSSRSEALVAAAFRGFAEALVAADSASGGKNGKEKPERPLVVPVDAVKRAVQDALPGILEQMAAEVPEEHPFGAGIIEEDVDERRRAQAGDGNTYDPNQPGAGGWRSSDA
jgi:hypothetical protein